MGAVFLFFFVFFFFCFEFFFFFLFFILFCLFCVFLWAGSMILNFVEADSFKFFIITLIYRVE